MDIYEEVHRQQQIAEDLFKKALSPTLNSLVIDIKKAKASPVGTVSTHGGIKMRKEANGWVPVKDGAKSPKEGESEGSDQAAPEALAEHAKNASEGALLSATKVSPDPKIREAAHKELMRRKNEEAGETFKAPEEGGDKFKDGTAANKERVDKVNTKADEKRKESENKSKEKIRGQIMVVAKQDGTAEAVAKIGKGEHRVNLSKEQFSDLQSGKLKNDSLENIVLESYRDSDNKDTAKNKEGEKKDVGYKEGDALKEFSEFSDDEQEALVTASTMDIEVLEDYDYSKEVIKKVEDFMNKYKIKVFMSDWKDEGEEDKNRSKLYKLQQKGWETKDDVSRGDDNNWMIALSPKNKK